MDHVGSMPVARVPQDPMKGMQSLAASMLPDHPVDAIQKSAAKNEFDAKLFRAEAIHGSHLSLHMRMERALLARHQRLPLLTSEFAGLDTVLNRDDTIDFSDFLAAPEDKPEMPTMGLHDIMEAKLGF